MADREHARRGAEREGGGEVTRLVGYCATCAELVWWAEERPVPGLARFGRCRLKMVPVGGGSYSSCHRWREAKRGGKTRGSGPTMGESL